MCDGIGGEAKRQASDSVKQGKAIIQDAEDFFAWASAHQKEIDYIFYKQGDYEDAATTLDSLDCKPIPGTMTTHAILPVNICQLLTRSVSYYCNNCLQGLNLRRMEAAKSTIEDDSSFICHRGG